MLVFGVDIPLVEVVLAFSIIVFILLAEAVVIIALLMKQLSKMKKITELDLKLSETMLAMKKAELQRLDMMKKKQ